tara:strand:+ start:4175 stop:4768 length:594 start_codon:yes stop_codon:yes gene_type:complete
MSCKYSRKCVCGWYGRSDNLKSHLAHCTARYVIEQLEIELKRKHSQSEAASILVNDLSVMCEQYPDIYEKLKELRLIYNTENFYTNEENLCNKSFPVNNFEKKGFLYIIKTRESIRLNEPVYKIGRTSDIQNRILQYPKGSNLITCISVSNQHTAEKILIREFSEKFTKRIDMGNEYFEGDLESMKSILNEYSKIFS